MKIQPIYKPTFDIPENMLFGIGERKIGDRVKFIIDYEAIEKTKSYIILRVNSAFLDTNKRKF